MRRWINKMKRWRHSGTMIFWIKIGDESSFEYTLLSKRMKSLLRDAFKDGEYVHVAFTHESFGRNRLWYINGELAEAA